MGSVCDCCVAAYCSCLAVNHGVGGGAAAKLGLLLGDGGGGGGGDGDGDAAGGLLAADFLKRWGVWSGVETDCAVHGQCSFCSKSLFRSKSRNERSVKRKLAKIYPGDGEIDDDTAAVTGGNLLDLPDGDGAKKMIDELSEALQSEREVVRILSMELEEERSAASVAATETLAMITRLQEEKAAVQMEASQYRRMVEERTQYDQGAIGWLNEMLARQEEERLALSREVEFYRSSSSLSGKNKDSSPSSLASGGGDSSYGKGGGDRERERRNLMDSFEKVDPRCMEADPECSVSSSSYEVSSRAGGGGGGGGSGFGSDEEKYGGPRWRASPAKKASSLRRYEDSGTSSSSRRDEEEEVVDDAVDRIVRSLARPSGKVNGELRELSRRLRALEAERDYREFAGGMRNPGGGGDMDILEEISQQLRQIHAKPDDAKELSEASFVFSFKGFFSFNGLRQSLNSNINRLACMFLKHTDAAGLSYGDHHVGLSHLLESSSSSRKAPRAVTRGLKADTPPIFPSSSNAVLHRQNLDWNPMDARGRSETAFGGWDY